MHSWRDGLSPAAQADLDRLLDSGLRLAQSHLAQTSEFTPFPLIVDVDGRLLAVDLDVSSLGKHPDEAEIGKAAAAQLRHLAPSARGTALVSNTRLAKGRTDAIEIKLEHSEGAALLVLLPYKRPTFGGRTDYGELKAFPGSREVWG
jgi:hypothetical protein